jgi:hypothetical protein
MLGALVRGVPFDLAVSCCGGISRCAYHWVIIQPVGRTSMNHPPSIPLPRLVVEAWSRYVLASVRHVLGGPDRSTYLSDMVTAWVISLDQGETALAVFAHALGQCEGEGDPFLSVRLRALPEASGFEVSSFRLTDDGTCDCSVCTSAIGREHWGCIVDRIGGDPRLN